MMERRIFLWMGLSVLFFTLLICTDGFADQQYKVKRGDSLVRIAKKYGVSTQSIKEANGLQGNALKPGKALVIPTDGSRKLAKGKKSQPQKAAQVYIVKKGDTVYGIAKKTGLSVSDIKALNHLRKNKLRTGQKLALVRSAPDNEARQLRQKKTAQSDLNENDGEDDLLSDENPVMERAAEKESDVQQSDNPLGKWRDPEERDLVVKVAKGFLGAPYRLGGSSVQGLDCSGFVRKIYEFFDVNLPRTAREQSRVGVKVAKGELTEGDLVFFNTRRASVGHVGIYIGNNQFVHASSGKNDRHVRIDSLDKPYYNQRFIKAVRLKALEADNDI
ncbi:MAG: NlpC/P60 family protein [Syntrophales bacterium]|jgi:cell wall-associated NlpC family hydrolase